MTPPAAASGAGFEAYALGFNPALALGSRRSSRPRRGRYSPICPRGFPSPSRSPVGRAPSFLAFAANAIKKARARRRAGFANGRAARRRAARRPRKKSARSATTNEAKRGRNDGNASLAPETPPSDAEDGERAGGSHPDRVGLCEAPPARRHLRSRRTGRAPGVSEREPACGGGGVRVRGGVRQRHARVVAGEPGGCRSGRGGGRAGGDAGRLQRLRHAREHAPRSGGSPDARGVGSPEAWDARRRTHTLRTSPRLRRSKRVSVSHAYARDALGVALAAGSSRPPGAHPPTFFSNATLPALCRWRQREPLSAPHDGAARRGRHVPSVAAGGAGSPAPTEGSCGGRCRRRRCRRASRFSFAARARVSADADAERDAERPSARAMRSGTMPSVFHGLAEPARRRLAVRRAAKRTRPRDLRRSPERRTERKGHRRLPCARRRRPSRSRGGVRRRAGRIRRGRAGRSSQGAARRRGGGGGAAASAAAASEGAGAAMAPSRARSRSRRRDRSRDAPAPTEASRVASDPSVADADLAEPSPSPSSSTALSAFASKRAARAPSVAAPTPSSGADRVAKSRSKTMFLRFSGDDADKGAE